MKNKAKCLMLVTCAVLLFTSCQSIQKNNEDDYISSYVFAMGTVFENRIYGVDDQTILDDIEDTLLQVEHTISWRSPGSVSAEFNEKHSADMMQIRPMIETALDVSYKSNGAFDLTVLPLSELWQFDKMGDSTFDLNEMCVPDVQDIDDVLQKIDYKKLKFDGETGVMSTDDPSQQIELGAIGKGYGIEAAKNTAVSFSSEICGGMISAGSSICVFGDKPDQSPFRIALRNPRGKSDDYLGLLKVKDCTVSTSGDYERWFEQDGIRYHHILDPRTGYPADSGLMQVTIIDEDSVLGDALSTACFVLGLADGMHLAEEYGVKAIFVDTDKNIWYNDPVILEWFEMNKDHSDYQLKEYTQLAASTDN